MKKRLFPLLITLAALAVSGSAAFYSVFGLSKLFAGASTQVIIMAGSLEFAKLVVASLLYQYWGTINKVLKGSMSKKVKINNMDKLLISIFRSAIYEILFSDNVTKKIVISEYLLIANRFFGNNETALINGVLDNLQNS